MLQNLLSSIFTQIIYYIFVQTYEHIQYDYLFVVCVIKVIIVILNKNHIQILMLIKAKQKTNQSMY